ncbi:MAG: aromatic amino acid transaminase [Lautropia sp.]
MPSSVFAGIPLAPKDPILGITELYNADPRTEKVNLGAGVYYDANGKLPLLSSVQQAETTLSEAHKARGYLPIDGLDQYNKAVQSLLFGADSALLTAPAAQKRVITVQALGGTGGLRIGADLLRRFSGDATVYISDPSWENHRALFEAAGFRVETYPYYDAESRGIDFSAMLHRLKEAADGSIIVLHACCHNPTGVDLTADQWSEVIEILNAKRHVPFLDIAYQGFGDGIDADAAVVRRFAAGDLPFLVSSSFSKSFSLYGERVGALTMVLPSADEAQRVLSQLKRVVRANYSNPPTHGGAIVTAVLNTPKWRALWEEELAGMRTRIKKMRGELVSRLKAAGVKQDFSFVERQRGMFSYSGLTAAQVDRLRDEHAIYAVSSGRICVASLNEGNIARVVGAIVQVL